MKKLLILGAGIYQVPLIKKAKEMGLYTIVASWPGNYPGWQFADKKYEADTTDYEKILEIAKQENIDGICTTGTDVAVKSIGKVVDELNLSGVSSEAGELTTNKLSMKKAFMDHNVRTARFIKVSSLEEAKEAFETLTKPVIFKVLDSSGSRGIFKVCDATEIPDTYEKTIQATRLSEFIIEEFVEGEEFGAQALVHENKVKFIMPHGDILHKGENSAVPIGHYVPYELKKSVLQDLETQLKNSITALKINNAAINADFIIKNDQVYVLEIGARGGATCLVEMVAIHYDIDYYQEIIKLSLGETPNCEPKLFTPCAGYLLTSPQTGVINKIENLNSPNENILDISFDYKPGDQVNKFQVGPDRIGQIVVKGKTLEETVKLAEDTISNINIEF